MVETSLRIRRSLHEKLRDQNFRFQDEQQRIKKLLVYLECRLFRMGAGEEVMKSRYEVNQSPKRESHHSFRPTIVDSLPKEFSTVGWIEGSDGNTYPLKRVLLGRTCDPFVNGHGIEIAEYFKPEENDNLLFRIAEEHRGLTGVEGVVIKTVSRQEAETLLFTRNGRYRQSPKVVVSNSEAGKKEMVTV